MSAQAEFRAALSLGDARLLRRVHPLLFPHLPAPESDEEAEQTMHMARTQAAWLSIGKRAWSHRWLQERGLPSQLPDELKPKAERMYPIIAEAVLVAVAARDDEMKPIAALVQQAQVEAVEDCYANGDRNPALVRARMEEAKRQTFKRLLGTVGAHP